MLGENNTDPAGHRLFSQRNEFCTESLSLIDCQSASCFLSELPVAGPPEQHRFVEGWMLSPLNSVL